MTRHPYRMAQKMRLARNLGQGRALVIVHDHARWEGDLVGVSGLNLPRLPGEAALLYVARLDAHVRETVPAERHPYVCRAHYADDME